MRGAELTVVIVVNCWSLGVAVAVSCGAAGRGSSAGGLRRQQKERSDPVQTTIVERNFSENAPNGATLGARRRENTRATVELNRDTQPTRDT